MAAMIPEQGIGRAQVQGAGEEAETVAVPASTLRLFLNLVTEMSQGDTRPCARGVAMSRSFAALLLLAFRAALCAQDAAVPPLEGTVIRRLGNTHWRSAVELHDPAFSPAGDSLARLRCVQVDRQEEKPAVDRHGDSLPRTIADKQSAVTLLLAIW